MEMRGDYIVLCLLLVAARSCLVHCCIRSASQEDVNALRSNVQELKRELNHLQIRHENLASESKTTIKESGKFKMPADVTDQLRIFNEKVEKLIQRQDTLEKHTEPDTQLLKKTVDNIGKQVDDKIEKMRKLLKDTEEKSNKQYDEMKKSIQKMETSVQNKLEEFLTNLKDMDNVTQNNYTLVKESLDDLNAVVNSDLKTKVNEFDGHITTVRNAKDEVDKILSNLQEVVEKIRPNTFNKDYAVRAFLIVVLFVFFLAFWLYKVQQSVTEMKKFQ